MSERQDVDVDGDRSRTDEPARRDILLAALGLALAGGVAAGDEGQAAVVAPGATTIGIGGRTLHVVDLTHELTTEFNWMPARPRIAMDPIIGSGLAAGMNLNRLMLVEHSGTHVDAPRHFADGGRSLGEMPIADLVVPLALIDLTARARQDPNAGLTPDDVRAWERRHGRLPEGCCVAINSGYDPLATMRGASAGAATPQRGSPGFTPEAAKFLMEQRSVKGIAVDAMSIDQGKNGPAYPVHQAWLRSGRWGIEGLTNLTGLPAAGAILIVGAAPIKDATGIPIRAIALF